MTYVIHEIAKKFTAPILNCKQQPFMRLHIVSASILPCVMSLNLNEKIIPFFHIASHHKYRIAFHSEPKTE